MPPSRLRRRERCVFGAASSASSAAQSGTMPTPSNDSNVGPSNEMEAAGEIPPLLPATAINACGNPTRTGERIPMGDITRVPTSSIVDSAVLNSASLLRALNSMQHATSSLTLCGTVGVTEDDVILNPTTISFSTALPLTDDNTDNTEAQDNSQSDKIACDVRGCPKFPPAVMIYDCENECCEKKVHCNCYCYIVGKSTSVTPLEDNQFCMVKCHHNYRKAYGSSALNWTNDGAKGRDDPYNSEYYLRVWINNEENYANFRGGQDHCGVSKLNICANIAQWIFKQGVKKEHNAEQVRAKISHIEARMKSSYDWENSVTGAGVLDNKGEISFRQTITDKNPYYFDLKDVFMSRSSMKPKCTTKDLFGELDLSDSDEEESKCHSFFAS